MNHIDKVGFEIEGGWKGEPWVSPFKDISLVQDHSINGQTLRTEAIRAQHVGEAISPPIPIADMTGDPAHPVWEEWLISHWPNAEKPHRTNNTCGFHIHISLDDALDYTLLTSKVFTFAVKEAMTKHAERIKLHKKHEFWNRINGVNTFCTYLTDPARQMALRQKGDRTRYGVMNYSYGIHGTAEFRALPTFRDVAVAVGFSQAFFDLVNSWLDANQPAEPLVRRETFKL